MLSHLLKFRCENSFTLTNSILQKGKLTGKAICEAGNASANSAAPGLHLGVNKAETVATTQVLAFRTVQRVLFIDFCDPLSGKLLLLTTCLEQIQSNT